MTAFARKVVLMSALGIALALPAGAQAVVLHDQRDNLGYYLVPSDDFRTSQDSYDNQLADDFTVPPGQSWTVSQVDLIGDAPSTGLVPIVNAWIYGSAGTVPGAQLFAQPGITATHQPNYTVPLTGAPALGPGSYWVSIQQTDAFDMSPTWTWKTRTVVYGKPSVFRNPPGGYRSGACRDWTPMADCFTGTAPDLAWAISGTAGSIPVTLGKPKRTRRGTARIAVNVPAPGTLTLSGKGVKGLSAQVAARKAASTVTLTIRATGKAKRSLESSGKAKVKAKFTYTAAGASPATTTRKLKLRKGPAPG